MEISFYNLTTDESGGSGGGGQIPGWEPLQGWTGTDESTGPEETQLLFHLYRETPTNWGGQSLRAEIFILKTEKKEKKNPNSTNKKQPT